MPPKKMTRTTYTSSNMEVKVWNNADKIRGKDEDLYRKDPYGNEMYKHSYGKTTAKGWQADHIKPKNKGGSNDIMNLQALNSHVNMSKGDTLVKKSRHSK